MSGRTVSLMNQAMTITYGTYLTDANGFYIFNGLAPGTYRITHSVPAGYVRTTDDSTVFNSPGSFVHDFGVYSSLVCNGGVDVGLRLYQDGVRRVAVEPGAATSSLKVYKNGIRGVVLVNTNDPNASRVRIQTSAGIKAFCLLP